MRRSLALVVAARRLMWPLSWALAFGGSLTLASLSRAGTNDKVTICHFPPGNPSNYQTITISAAALPAHLAHGDFPGSCANDCKLFGSVCDDGISAPRIPAIPTERARTRRQPIATTARSAPPTPAIPSPAPA